MPLYTIVKTLKYQDPVGFLLFFWEWPVVTLYILSSKRTYNILVSLPELLFSTTICIFAHFGKVKSSTVKCIEHKESTRQVYL